MKDLLYIRIGDSGFGVWDEEILDVKENLLLHRIPLTSGIYAGIAQIENRVATIADLAACIGLPQIKSRLCHVLIFSNELELAGFAIEQGVKRFEISQDKIFKLPGCIHSEIMDTCVVLSGTPVPVINIKSLYGLVKNKNFSPGKIPFSSSGPKPADSPAVRTYKYISVCGNIFALPKSGLREELPRPGKVTPSILFPEHIKGVTIYNDGILPLVSLSRRMSSSQTESGEHTLIMDIEGNAFGFIADSSAGESGKEIEPVRLPPLVQTGWMKEAIIDNGKIIPVIDPAALIFPEIEGSNAAMGSLYNPENTFMAEFGKNDVEVTEFYQGNAIYSIPLSEIKAAITLRGFIKIPGVSPIVIGITEFEGDILPVVDLSLYFGFYSQISPEWKMLLVEKGNFRAFIVTRKIGENRSIRASALSRLPIRLPHNAVYGCYPDPASGSLRLILNSESMIVHFDKDYIKDYFHSLSADAAAPQIESGAETPAD